MNRRNEYSGTAHQGTGSQRPQQRYAQDQQRYSQDWTDDDYRSGRNRMEASYEEDYDVRSGSDERYAAGSRSYERGYGNQGGMRGGEPRDDYGSARGMAPRSQSPQQTWGYGEYDSERQTSYGRGPAGDLGIGYGGMSGSSYEGGYGGGNMGQNRFGAPRNQSMGSNQGRDTYQGNHVRAGSWNDDAGSYAQRGYQGSGQWGGTQGVRSSQWGESGNYNQAGGAFGQAGNYGPGPAASGSYGGSGYGQTNYWGQSQGTNPDPYGYGRGGSDIGYGSNYGSANYGAGAGYGNYGPSGRPGGGFGGTYGGGMSGSGSGMQPGGYQSQGTSGYAQGMGQRNFSGRGPKGYARSDERLKEDINERLTDDPLIDASDVSVEVRDGKVTLTGQVDERWLKHSIEDLVDRCAGVKDIDNRLTVASSRSSSSISGTTASGTGTSTGSSNFSGQGDGDSFTGSTSRSAGSTTTGTSPSSTSTSTKKN